MARKPGEPETPEFDEMRRKMDRLKGSDKEKMKWGIEIGTRLYEKEIGK